LGRYCVEFRVLGPLEVAVEDQMLDLGGGKQRTLLAILALRAGRVVPVDALIDGLWGERPPPTAAKSVQVYVSRLRKSLGESAIVTRAPGYLLDVAPEDVDLLRFERMVEEARHEPPAAAAATLRAALELWRGPALADVQEEPYVRTDAARLEELRLGAVQARIEADLALGEDAQVIGELEGLVRAHPYREPFRRQLMLALYRSGRQAEALEVYRETRQALSDELGLEPGDDLRDLERRILAHDPALTGPKEKPLDESQPAKSRRRPAVVIAVVLLAAVGATVGVVTLTSDAATPVVVSSNSVAVIDPERNEIDKTIPLGERPTRIAIHGDDVWVLQPDRRTVSHLSRTERAVLGTVGVGSAPSNLVAERRGVWVSDARTGRLTLIEPERLTVAKTIRTRRRPLLGPYSDAGLLAIGYGSLWVASGERTVTRVDPETGEIRARIRDVETGESDGGIAVGGGSVWVAGPLQGSPLTRIDPRTNRVLARVTLPKFRSNGIAVGGGDVWVSDAGSDQVWRVDPLRNVAIGTAHVGAAPVGVLSAHGSIWVANAGDGTLTRIDPITGRVVTTVEVGGSPNGLAATDDAVWVTVA
jgi:YVTN family beta-propeller protein